MIYYKTKGRHFWLNLVRWKGSSFKKALCFAIPCSCVTAFFKLCINENYFSLADHGFDQIVQNNVVWTGFTVLLGFLVVFRTSQAYNRFLEGASNAHKMRVEWFDACAALIAFTRHNKKEAKKITDFQGLLVRLFSMLHAVALAEIEDSNSERYEDIKAFKFDLIDVGAIDALSLEAIRNSDTKPELLYHWINQLAVEGMANGILTIPPPIVSRFFQTLANGMVAFHEAVKLASVPFPFPYCQTCDWLLLLHWMTTPIIIAQWVPSVRWCAIFAFIQVFIVWSLNGIAQEIENPFGQDANDLNCESMQEEMNQFLMMLIDPVAQRLPELTEEGQALSPNASLRKRSKRSSFLDVWADIKNQAHSRNSSASQLVSFESSHFTIANSVRSVASTQQKTSGHRSIPSPSVRSVAGSIPEMLPLHDSSIGKSTANPWSKPETSDPVIGVLSGVVERNATGSSSMVTPLDQSRSTSASRQKVEGDQSKSSPMPSGLTETPQKKLGEYFPDNAPESGGTDCTPTDARYTLRV